MDLNMSKKSPALEGGDNETVVEKEINILGNEGEVENCDTAEPEDRNAPEDTTTTGINDILPAEILMRIFKMMNNTDLSKVVSVCRRWREVGDCVWNWNNGRINISGSRDIEMLAINRVQHIGELSIYSCSDEDLDGMFETIASLSKLTSLWMPDFAYPATLDPSLLVNTLLAIETVDIPRCDLTVEQLNKLFGEINETTKLQSLILSGANLSGVDKDILTAGVNQLQSVELLHSCDLTDEQLNKLFGSIKETTKLQNLTLYWVDLRGVDEDILAAGINQLQRAELEGCKLDARQATAVLTQAGRKTSLGYLGIYCYGGVTGTVDKEIERLARMNIGNLDLEM